MKKYYPQDTSLAKHVNYYWIVNDARQVFKHEQQIYAYPGITPEMIIILDGSLSYIYKNKKYEANESILASFIHHEVILDTSKLNSFVLIQFHPKALASLLPFINISTLSLMQNCMCNIENVFGDSIKKLRLHFKKLSHEQIVDEIEEWLNGYYQKNKEGFITEMVAEFNADINPKHLLAKTGYSYSTLERYFKKETGLTPKKYLSLQRYKLAVEEIYDTYNTDWLHYVNKYGYFDQSHFIKEIKRFTTFTPAQLLTVSGLRRFRPENL